MAELLELLATLHGRAPLLTRWIATVALLLGLLGLLAATWQSWRLRGLARRLRLVLNGGELTRTSPEVAGDLEASWDEIRDMPAPRAFREALERLARARTRPVGLPEEAWRGAYDQILAEESRRETFVRGLASAAVLAGLLGTVAGFAEISRELVMLAIPQSRDDGSQSEQRARPAGASARGEALETKLGGVFISTIAGIVGALLVLGVGAPMLRASADRWLGAVEDAGRLVIVPALPRPPTRIQDALVEELQRRIATVAQAWESSLRGPAAALAEVAETSRRAAEAAGQALEGVRISVDDLRELGNSANRIRRAAQSMEGTASVYVAASDRLAGAVERLETTLPRLSGDLQSLGQRLAGVESAVGSGARAVSDSGDALRVAVESMASNFQELERAVSSRHERESGFLEQTTQAVRLIEERLNGLEAAERAIRDQANETNLALGALSRTIGQTLEPLKDTIKSAISETFGDLLARQADVFFGAARRMEHDAAEMTRQLGSLRSATETLLSAHAPLGAAAGQLTARAEELARTAEQIGTTRAFDRLAAAVERLSNSELTLRAEPALVVALTEAIERGVATAVHLKLDPSELATLERGVTNSVRTAVDASELARVLRSSLARRMDGTFRARVARWLGRE